MFKKFFIGFSVIVFAVILGITAYILRPASEASAPIEAAPVEIEQPQPDLAQSAGAASDENSAASPLLDPTGVEQPGEMAVFSILQQDSEARFTLDEILRGAPKTVIGTTDQIAGEIAIDFANPANSKVGTIRVNARSLVTDNEFRDRAINNEILKTRDYEFITFTPTQISGFPENPAFGEALTFQIIGDLTIRDITHAATFDAKVTADSETRLTGYASTVVSRAVYGLNIPSVASVANVDEDVLLEIEFVAALK